MAHNHVFGSWASYDARWDYRRCLRCGFVQYRPKPNGIE